MNKARLAIPHMVYVNREQRLKEIRERIVAMRQDNPTPRKSGCGGCRRKKEAAVAAQAAQLKNGT
jgi:hypothetical protein